MKRWIQWTIAVLVLALLAGSIWRTLANRKQQQAALAAASADKAQTLVVLAPGDTVLARSQAGRGRERIMSVASLRQIFDR